MRGAPGARVAGAGVVQGQEVGGLGAEGDLRGGDGRPGGGGARCVRVRGVEREVPGGREVVADELGAGDPVPGLLRERQEGGVHDQPDRDPGQFGAQGGPSAGPFPRGRLCAEAAVPGASRHRGPVEGAPAYWPEARREFAIQFGERFRILD